jgi:hypothetical protein
MSDLIEPAPVLRICSWLTADDELRAAAERVLAEEVGEVALRSGAFEFDTSHYYREEMGAGLRRTWCCFGELFGAERLPDYRELTGRVEDQFAVSGCRRVNLDPGYLDHGKLVLASLKEAPDHSFPDFRDGRFNRFMLEARTLYKELLKLHQVSL